jgi:DNA (cytosine-5)-methyltransferase 1
MKFVDLFAGLGGFHLALKKLGHTCVFACEIDETLRRVYKLNFGMEAAADIRRVPETEVPAHDILCAGFPCQPFSKAGSQTGLKDPDQGTLFFDILRIIEHHKPRYLILENVPNFERHDDGKTWEKIERLLRRAGYDVSRKKLSPHLFGIPQIRERIYIVGGRDPLNGFVWPCPTTTETSIRSVLDDKPAEARAIPDQVRMCLAVWQDFLNKIPKEEKILHPIWSMEFGATYPYEDKTPYSLSTAKLRRYKGSFGQSLNLTDRQGLFRMLPSHARREQPRFPGWKVEFIRKNRAFYKRHKSWLDSWKPKIMKFPSSFQKLEWNCQGERRELSRYVIQIRASGVRVKRPTTAPSLVAMTATQVPIIAWDARYMTPAECKKLQSMDDLVHLPEQITKVYEALGNAVSVEVARIVAKALLGDSSSSRSTRDPEESKCVDSISRSARRE